METSSRIELICLMLNHSSITFKGAEECKKCIQKSLMLSYVARFHLAYPKIYFVKADELATVFSEVYHAEILLLCYEERQVDLMILNL